MPKPARCKRAFPGFPALSAFTIIELLIVMAVIIILAGLILVAAQYVQNKGYRARAEAEIAAMSAALENYKADNGIYPPASGAAADHGLYQALTGDGDDAIGGSKASTGTPGSSGKSYVALKSNMVSPNPPSPTSVVRDPFGNLYKYLSPGAVNPTFDLWSTAGNPTGTDQLQWIKNW